MPPLKLNIKLKRILERRGMTQKQLSEKLRISESVISMYIKHGYPMSSLYLDRIKKFVEDNS